MSVLDSRDVLIRHLYVEIERLKMQLAARFVRETLADLGQIATQQEIAEIARRVAKVLPSTMIETSGGHKIRRRKQ